MNRTAGWFPLRWSLRRRITASSAVATAAVALLLAASLVGIAGYLLRTQVDDELQASADTIAVEIAAAPVALSRFDAVEAPPGVAPSSSGGPILSRVIDSSGRTEIGSPIQSLPVGDIDLRVALGTPTKHFDDIVTADEHYRTLTVTVDPSSNVRRDLAVQVAKPVSELDRALVILVAVGIAVSAAGLFAAAGLAWWVSRSAIRPVDAFADTVEHVARTGDLTVTVPRGGASELARLGESFNALMASLETARRQQRQLIADAGHELRTPLTSIRTNLELLAEAERAPVPPADRAELLAEVNQQFEELTSLVADVVALARDDDGTREWSEVRLDRVVERAVERARRRAGSVRIEVTTDPAVLDGQATLLERAVLNVLDNALKWSPTDGVVTVRQHGADITVDDQGPGIAPEDRLHVFERFWRASTARSVPGSGLGLAIVAQVVVQHGGYVWVDDRDGVGTRVALRFPSTRAL